MYTYEQLMQDMKKMPLNKKGTLLIHSSCKSIGNVENRADTVLDVWMDFMKEGLLVLPTHTWDRVIKDKNDVMDVISTGVCVGILPELFRQRKNVRGSLHPTHSLAAFGKDAESFISGEEFAKTPCPPNFAYYKLLERKAKNLLVGVDFTRNTFIHGIEEWEHVRGTISEETHDLYVLAPDGKKYHTPQNRHCAPIGSKTFWKLGTLMLREGAMTEARFGDAVVKIVDTVRLYDVLSEMLRIDNQVLMTNDPLHAKFYTHTYPIAIAENTAGIEGSEASEGAECFGR